jgi:hypothetical protein
MNRFEKRLARVPHYIEDPSLSQNSILDGFEGLRKIEHLLQAHLPTADEIRLYRPMQVHFIHRDHAIDPDNPHNEGHFARTLIGAALLAAIRKHHAPTLFINKKYVLTALKYHDVRQGRWNNNPYHPKDAVDVFLNNKEEQHMFPIEKKIISHLILHHSNFENPSTAVGKSLSDMLRTLQDADASDLMRPQLASPVVSDKVRLRTQEAREYHLPYVTQLIEIVGRHTNTGDIFEDQLIGAQYLGLLRHENV